MSAPRTRPFVALSPGARSTPLVVALARAALAGELDLLDVVDERSAAFVALGHARVTGRPACVVCTSGTAPAHWYPAVIEASEAQIPLVLLSADRPTELHHAGAPQTVEQGALFGTRVRFFADLGDPQASEAWLDGVRRTVAHAIARATSPRPGPVHLNVRARKPLEPSGTPDATARMADAVLDGLLGRGLPTLTRPVALLPDADAQRLAARLARAERPLVVLGPAAAHQRRADVARFLERLGAPFFAEPASQLRFGERPEALAIDGLDLVLASGSALAAEPDLVVEIGGTPTSGALERFLGARPSLPRIVLGVAGPTFRPGAVEEIVVGEVDATLAAIERHLPSSVPTGSAPSASSGAPWLRSLRALDARAWACVEQELRGEADRPAGPLSEGGVARAACAALSAGGALLLGNSLPIRLVDRFVRGGGAARAVLSQRGVNGIDGLVSGAIGGARALDAPLLALLGDLTTLHDLGALAAVPRSGAALVLVVLRNGGGRIFEQLPIGARDDLAFAMPHMVTETNGSLADVARALGLRAARVETPGALAGALTEAMRGAGTTLIEAIVPPHDAREREAHLLAAMRSTAARQDA